MATVEMKKAASAKASVREPHNKPLGQLLVQLGYLRDEDLGYVLEVQRAQTPGNRKSIGRICVELGYLSKERLDLILDRFGKRLRLGELLVNRGRLTSDQVDEVLEHQTHNGGRFGEILVEKGYVDEDVLSETLAEQYDLAFLPLRDLHPDPALVRYVNAAYAASHRIAPVGRSGRRLTIAVADPTLDEIVKDLELSTGFQIQMVMATPSDVESYVERLYGANAANAAHAAHAAPAPANAPRVATGAGIDRLLRSVLTRAHARQAVDVRFGTDPSRPHLWVRATAAYEPLAGCEIDRHALRGCVRALKDRAGLDGGETSRPQEGIFSFSTEEGDFSKKVSAAVTTCPGLAGEDAHVRFLSAGSVAPWAMDSGVRETRRGEIGALVSHGRGVLLIAGPAGSGKRRMLRFIQYFLKEKGILLHSAEERMIERNLGVMQAEADPRHGQDYAHLLETFIAHGTDAVLVDRLEDAATARAVFTAVSSGPLIVCAITAANATNAVERLEGFGVDRETVADSLLAVLGQRLLRRVCPDCSTRYKPRRAVLEEWFAEPPSGIEWQRGAGCLSCAGSGFDGRVLATELWKNGPGMRRAILESRHGSVLRDQMLRFSPGFGEDALGHALDGSTTLEEALKVIPYEDVAATRLNEVRGEV